MSSATSANHSFESGASSLQRSGLSMSVGDTKSIVLALQALQGKIRTLEQDRNYHQDQYEQALHAHDAYKMDMERQLERERSMHRQRERELQELLRKAQEEKMRMESTLDGSRDDLGAFRHELEELITCEKEAAKSREAKLLAEVEQLRREVTEERNRHLSLQTKIDTLRAERAAAHETNQQLQQALEEVMHRKQHRLLPPQRRQSRSMRNVRAPRRGTDAQLSRPVTSISQPHSMHHSRNTYQDPTCNSILRDVRNISGEAPCCNDTILQAASPSAGGRSPANASRTASTGPPLHRTPTPTGHPPPMRSPPRRMPVSLGSPMDAVCGQLAEELEDLKTQYRDTLARGSREEISAEVLSAALNRIATLMDSKREQLRLLKEAQVELNAAATSNTSGTLPSNGTGAGLNTVPQRQLLVNELRSMLAESSVSLRLSMLMAERDDPVERRGSAIKSDDGLPRKDEGDDGSLASRHMKTALSVLGNNEDGHVVFTCCDLRDLRLRDVGLLGHFPFLQKVMLDNNALTSLSPLQHLRSMVHLSATNNRLGNNVLEDFRSCALSLERLQLDHNEMTSLLGLQHFSYLVEFSASYNQIEKVCEAHFRGLQGLTRLQLSHNVIQRIDSLAFSGSRNIRSLHISHNRIEDLHFAACLSDYLDTLQVSHNKVAHLGTSLSSCRSLASLDLSANAITSIDELRGLCPLQALHFLFLAGNPLLPGGRPMGGTLPSHPAAELPLTPSGATTDAGTDEWGDVASAPADDANRAKTSTGVTGAVSATRLAASDGPTTVNGLAKKGLMALASLHTQGPIKYAAVTKEARGLLTEVNHAAELARLPGETQVRLQVLDLLPQLLHLDEAVVKPSEVAQAHFLLSPGTVSTPK